MSTPSLNPDGDDERLIGGPEESMAMLLMSEADRRMETNRSRGGHVSKASRHH